MNYLSRKLSSLQITALGAALAAASTVSAMAEGLDGTAASTAITGAITVATGICTTAIGLGAVFLVYKVIRRGMGKA